MPYTAGMRALLIAIALALAFTARAATPYASVTEWSEDATTLAYQIDAFDKCRGRMAERPRFSGCLRLWEDAYRRWNRMNAYAAERLAQDATSAEASKLAERSKALGARLDEASAFLQPEVHKLGRVKVARLLSSEKGLSKYRHPLEAMLNTKSGEAIDARALWQ